MPYSMLTFDLKQGVLCSIVVLLSSLGDRLLRKTFTVIVICGHYSWERNTV
jgi:hypothetical protein